MAGGNDRRSYSDTLSTTVADTILLTQPWGAIEITVDADADCFVRFDGTTAVAGAEGCQRIAAGTTKTFGPADGIMAQIPPIGVPGSSTAATACHRISLVGNGNEYTVAGTVPF